MKAEELLVNLLKQIESLSELEYERLCELTESENFISLSERQIRFWLKWEEDKKAA